jgi:hypothetical protein
MLLQDAVHATDSEEHTLHVQVLQDAADELSWQ